MQFATHDPRGSAREWIKASVDAGVWELNDAFTRQLASTIVKHRLHRHPIVEAWRRNEFTLEGMKLVHLEIRAGFLESFMESLLRLMQTASHLERRLGVRAKMAARFLVQLNVLDELGFKSDQANGIFAGHPGYSHYWKLMETMEILGITEADAAAYKPSPEAVATRASLEDAHDDHLRLAVVLAAIETAFMPYYSPWARNAVFVCKEVEIPDGYHTIHIEDDDGHFVDDEHSEDSWYIVRQALTKDRYVEIESFTVSVLDTWARLMDRLVARNHDLKRAA